MSANSVYGIFWVLFKKIKFFLVGKIKFLILVGNLPFNVTENDVGNHFAQCGEVASVRLAFLIRKFLLNYFLSLIYDRTTNRFKGFGFCEFKDGQGAQDAVSKLNGADFNGRALKVDFAGSKWSKAWKDGISQEYKEGDDPFWIN